MSEKPLFDRNLEEEFISCLGWAAVKAQTTEADKYIEWLSDGLSLDPNALFFADFREMYLGVRFLINVDGGFNWQLLRSWLIERGHEVGQITLAIVDAVISESGGRPYAIPQIRKRLETLADRRRESHVKQPGRRDVTYAI